jgi:hypothetical protein
MSQFFIHRPVFAWVIAIVIMLAGVLGIVQLPIAQFPAIAPPGSHHCGHLPWGLGANPTRLSYPDY